MSLLIALILFLGISCGDISDLHTNLERCKQFYITIPKPYPLAFIESYGLEHSDLIGKAFEVSENYSVDYYTIYFKRILLLTEERRTTTVCVGFSKIFIRVASTEFAGISFEFNAEIPVGIVTVSTMCMRDRRRLEECNPVFMPMLGVMDVVAFAFSTINGTRIQNEHFFQRNWLTDLIVHSIPSVSHISISSLQTLTLTENNWGHGAATKAEATIYLEQHHAGVTERGGDVKWITEQLVPNIENGPEEYQLCLHHGECTLGAGIDMDIVESLQKSRKVIFVLSSEFISSEWCQWELEVAKQKMFNPEREHVILIELEPLDWAGLPESLQDLMETGTRLEWPREPEVERRIRRFWQRLRTDLGDSVRHRAARGNSAGRGPTGRLVSVGAGGGKAEGVQPGERTRNPD